MPLDRHAKRLLEMLAAAGETRGRYGKAQERRHALNHLADLVDPPGITEIGGVRDHLLSTGQGAILLRLYSPLGKPERVLPGRVGLVGREARGRSTPDTVIARRNQPRCAEESFPGTLPGNSGFLSLEDSSIVAAAKTT